MATDRDEGTQFTRLIKTLGKKGINHDRPKSSTSRMSAFRTSRGRQFYPAILKANKSASASRSASSSRASTSRRRSPRRWSASPTWSRSPARQTAPARSSRNCAAKVSPAASSARRSSPTQTRSTCSARDADGMIIVAGYWWDRNDATRAFTKKFDAENAKRGLDVQEDPPPHRRASI